jgi:hypothetical protein
MRIGIETTRVENHPHGIYGPAQLQRHLILRQVHGPDPAGRCALRALIPGSGAGLVLGKRRPLAGAGGELAYDPNGGGGCGRCLAPPLTSPSVATRLPALQRCGKGT